jgi:hypothetical protein
VADVPVSSFSQRERRIGGVFLLIGQLLALVACSVPSPNPTDSPRSSIQPVAGPLTIADCGWPPDTAIAYQGWNTEAGLGLPVSSPTGERFYWLVTADPVELVTSQGTGIVRVACAVSQDGLRSYRRVADDWEPPPPN